MFLVIIKDRMLIKPLAFLVKTEQLLITNAVAEGLLCQLRNRIFCRVIINGCIQFSKTLVCINAVRINQFRFLNVCICKVIPIDVGKFFPFCQFFFPAPLSEDFPESLETLVFLVSFSAAAKFLRLARISASVKYSVRA